MKTFRLGLTGSIGMGKSTTAAIFAAEGIPVWDADAAVHRLYQNGLGAEALHADFPDAVEGSFVSRETLKNLLMREPSLLSKLEAAIHPLVAQDRDSFIKSCSSDILVLDIPLLFEKNGNNLCDAVLLVTAPADLQRKRVLSRPNMTERQLEFILSRQMPDKEKRSRADHIVETLSFEAVRAYVVALIDHIRTGR